MAEEVATSQASPASQERGIFSLYGYFDKKKENEEPEESQDQPAAKTENQTSQHHTTDPPHAASETEVTEDPTDPPGHGAAAVEEEEEEEEEEGHDLTSQNQTTDPPHAATESDVKEGERHGDDTDSQTQPAYDLYPTEPPGDAADAVEKEEGGADTYPETRPAAATTEIAEERYDDQIIPPANTQTQPADLYPIEPPTAAAAAAPPENTQGHANSDKGQDINGFDEKQADTHGSTSSYESEEDEEDNSQKEEEEKKIKGDSVKNNIQGQLPEEQPSPSTEFANEEKFYPQSHENEGKVEEKKEGVKKKRTVKDKIKEKLASVGHHSTDSGAGEESPGKESPGKAGLLDRIKEKIPGHHA